MKISTFASYADKINFTPKGNEKIDIAWQALQEMNREEAEGAFLALVTQKKYNDIGVSKKTVRNALQPIVGKQTLKQLEKTEKGLPSAVETALKNQENTTLSNDPYFEGKDIDITTLENDLRFLSKETKDSVIEEKVREMVKDYAEPRWVTHALLGKSGVSLGFGVKTASKMLRKKHGIDKNKMLKARAVCTDISKLNRLAPNVPTSPRFGEPIKPMLASSRDVPEDVSNWIIQPKYDGARVIIQYNQGNIHVFSRRLNEVTISLPEIKKYFENVPDNAKLILDGEAVPFKDGEQQTSQQVMTRFNRKHNVDEQEIDIKFRFFDLLYAQHPKNQSLNGDISGESNEKRLELLDSPPISKWLPSDSVVPSTDAKTPANVHDVFEQWVKKGYEGVIIKDKNSKYDFDKRSQYWRKMKDMKENIDLEIVKVNEGEDQHAGRLGTFTLATKEGEVIGKVGTGFSEKEREELWEKRDELVGRVCEVKWQEVQKNKDGSYGLRFPAYKCLRDKLEADPLEKILNI